MKLVLEHIRKSHGGRPVLRDCSHVFDAGGVHVLMGPNGCGKSTLLRICALLDAPDEGCLHFSDNSAPLAQDLFLRRRLTLLLPRIGVFNASVFSNVAYGLSIRGFEQPVLARKVEESLAFVGLEHLAEQNALTLSSGETQRMGLARSLAIEPEMLFLDEPTASVDEENALLIESVIGGLRRNGKTSVIMTTHDRDQAMRLADDLLVLAGGELLKA